MLVFYTCITTTASKQRNLFADNFYEQKEISLQTISYSKKKSLCRQLLRAKRARGGVCLLPEESLLPRISLCLALWGDVPWCPSWGDVLTIHILHRNISFFYYVQLLNCQKLTYVDLASTHDGGWTLRWQHRHIQPAGKRNHMCEHWTSMLLWSFSVKGKKWFGMLSRSLLN